ncbi:MAG: aminomethyl-transferring glycine dehydrogenase subunit GcvPB [Phycisphaerales bacterium]|nr:MAG: aminomethyl-transferring glycine dehydrogenase subunit GcvPB [Phycisphaerales bacterium]
MDEFRIGSYAPEPLIFEQSGEGKAGVYVPDSDVPPVAPTEAIPAALLRRKEDALPFPEVGEFEVVRHFTRLGSRLFGVDANFYPLGSCTMKYNPKINELAAAMPGFAGLHPYQPVEQTQGILELLYHLRVFLAEIAGLAEVTLQPAAGAHGEMTGLMLIDAYHRSRGEDRPDVLAPSTAHGTNPASCAMCGRGLVTISVRDDGLLDLDHLRANVNERTSALMLTNPNTAGLFDPQMKQIADVLHSKGAQLYMDGANMNAMLGIARPGQFGVDVMHYNTHKTFSTPHGGGGPGSGPVAVAEHLRPFLPVPQVVCLEDGTYAWSDERPKTIGKVRSFYGQIGVLVRAYTYIRGLGPDGLRDLSEKAVLAANYLAARLAKHYHLPYKGPFAHEFILVPQFSEQGVTELDVAKRLLDYGFHPPTMSWPIMHCLMIEPTESESLATLDFFAEAMIRIAGEAAETPHLLHQAPHTTPVRRVDVVNADRKPNHRWRPEGESA